MTKYKYKCDNCGEKHDKMHIVIECSDCYMNGWKKQWKENRKDNPIKGYEKPKKAIKELKEFKVTGKTKPKDSDNRANAESEPNGR